MNKELQPGRELDALVAEKVMGFKNLHRQVDCITACISSARLTAWQTDRGVIPEDLLPKYSTDISAAWEVVEKLFPSTITPTTEHRAAGISITRVFKKLEELSSGNIPHTVVHEPVATYQVLFYEYNKIQSFSDIPTGKTLPHAICLAALKAVGYE